MNTNPIIGLCAGHCKQVPGAGRNGIFEQPVNRRICFELAERLLSAGLGVIDPMSDTLEYPPAVLIADVYPELAPRIKYTKATPAGSTIYHRIQAYNDEGVDLAIDMHFNASWRKRENYCSVVYHPMEILYMD